jgi:APA family basic amino acid/polyamine antiporter
MLGVLLNLVLGLSRVVLAMARRRDLPGGLAEVRSEQRGPTRAVLLTGVAVAALVLTGDIGLTWSVSAFTVLVYYAITNLAVLRLPAEARRYPRWIAAAGLAGCLGVGVWVETRVWVGGLAVILLAVTVHAARSRLGGRAAGGPPLGAVTRGQRPSARYPLVVALVPIRDVIGAQRDLSDLTVGRHF